MAKKQLANFETDRDVNEFIESVPNSVRRNDSYKLIDLMSRISGSEPKIWGKSIVAFGKYTYQRKNGEEYEWFNVGFSPGNAHMSLYLMYDVNSQEELLERLGPHKTGKGCLYIKRLEQVDMSVLEELIKMSGRWT